MTDHDDQTPTRADFRRAAALFLRRRHHDHAGVNTIRADADNRQRCSALVLAAIDLAFQSPYALASPAGIAEVVPGLVELEVAVPRSRPAVW